MAKAVPKTSSGKKPAPKAKTAAGAKKKSAGSTELNSLAKELKSLIPKMDEEGLAFLVKQAHVHLYNMQVDALNKTLVKEEERKKVYAQKSVKMGEMGFSDIKISESGSSYYIVYNNEWITFTRDEMTIIVKIALGEGTDLEIRERLFTWLSRERNDLIYSAGIADKFDDKLKSLVSLLKGNFKLKNK